MSRAPGFLEPSGHPESLTERDGGDEGFVLKGDRVPKTRVMGFGVANLDHSPQRTGFQSAEGQPVGGATEPL